MPITDCDRWFRPEVAADLARLRQAILLASGDMNVTICCGVFLIADRGAHIGRERPRSRAFAAPYRAGEQDPACIDRFLTRMTRARRMMAEYKDRLSANGILHPDAGIIGGDARSLDMAPRLLYRVYRALSRPAA